MTSEVELASQILVIVGQKPDARLPSFTADELFQQATRKQLLDCAQTLGLTGVSKLVKEELAGRVKTAFDGLRAAIARSQSDPAESRKADAGEPVDARHEPPAATRPFPRRLRTPKPRFVHAALRTARPRYPASSILARRPTPSRCRPTSPGVTTRTGSPPW